MKTINVLGAMCARGSNIMPANLKYVEVQFHDKNNAKSGDILKEHVLEAGWWTKGKSNEKERKTKFSKG